MTIVVFVIGIRKANRYRWKTIKRFWTRLRQKVEKIMFAGGEPLLYPGIKMLIQYAKEKGLCTALTTNGRFLSVEQLERIAPYLDWLTISLDAPNVTVQRAMTRAADHY